MWPRFLRCPPQHKKLNLYSIATRPQNSSLRSVYSVLVIENFLDIGSYRRNNAFTRQWRYSSYKAQHHEDLVSIIDHLEDVRKIPLADVRNFCIIAHVVSSKLLVQNLFCHVEIQPKTIPHCHHSIVRFTAVPFLNDPYDNKIKRIMANQAWLHVYSNIQVISEEKDN
jgi:hypothetical protein